MSEWDYQSVRHGVGEVMFKFAQVGGFGTGDPTRVGCPHLPQRNKADIIKVKFGEIRTNGNIRHPGFGSKYPVPAGSVLNQLHDAAGAYRQHNPGAESGGDGIKQCFIHRHIGNAQVARQKLNVREYIALAGGDDAGYRGQIFCG